MSKAEKFIEDYTMGCSNEIENGVYHEWLSPEQAKAAVVIARDETLQDVKRKLLNMLNTSVDNKHFFEQLDEYIDELENKQ